MSEDVRAHTALSLSGISKRFRSVTALDDVSMVVRTGTVHALLGENGAGKTTLMRVGFGLAQCDSGAVTANDGRDHISSPADAIAAGIGMVHQHFSNVPAMTVAENVALGGHGLLNIRHAAERVLDIGARSGLALDPNARGDSLSVGAQQRLEIVKALAHGARTLILDEPTAVLAPDEARALLQWLRSFADQGNSVVLITHKLRDALSIGDEVTVLRRGRAVLNAAAKSLTEGDLAKALLGEESTESREPRARGQLGDVVATLDHVSVADSHGITTLRDTSMTIRRGEIVGVAAVEGSGQRELLRVLAKRATPIRGTVQLPGRIGFVPEDRHRDALVLDFSAAENLLLKDAGKRRGLMPWSAAAARLPALARDFDVRGGETNLPVASMSGGNQQKFVLAREVENNPDLLVAENPTRGLDIRAARAVQQRMASIAAAGAAVVFHSGDIDEVLAVATRIVVVYAGTVLDVPSHREDVGRAMLGVD